MYGKWFPLVPLPLHCTPHLLAADTDPPKWLDSMVVHPLHSASTPLLSSNTYLYFQGAAFSSHPIGDGKCPIVYQMISTLSWPCWLDETPSPWIWVGGVIWYWCCLKHLRNLCMVLTYYAPHNRVQFDSVWLVWFKKSKGRYVNSWFFSKYTLKLHKMICLTNLLILWQLLVLLWGVL